MGSYVFFSDRPLEKYHKSDFWFLLSTFMLLGLGLVTLYLASQTTAEKMYNDKLFFVKKQLICAAIGMFFLMLFSNIKISIVKKCLPGITVVTILMCLLMFIPGLGVSKHDAVRWLAFPFGISFQPSEFVKFTMVLYLANYFDKEADIENPDEKTLFPCIVMMFFLLALVAFQKDFSTTIFIFMVCVVMFIASGQKILWILKLSPLILGTAFAFVLSEQYRVERVRGFLNPKEEINTINYQPNGAKKAISTGGFWGTGIDSNLNVSMRIPEVQSDYIFAVWSESMGIFGIFVYFLLLGFFAFRGYRAAFICKNRFASYSAFGFVTLILFQSLVNCAVVCGALPSTGIPLPFFSMGGTSLIVTLSMCGFIINASRYDTENDIVDENNKILINSFSGVNVYE